jgi:hypothetical protein
MYTAMGSLGGRDGNECSLTWWPRREWGSSVMGKIDDGAWDAAANSLHGSSNARLQGNKL